MTEPRIALAASPREWAQALHRHVVDHGGALVRATVLHPEDAIDEDYDVFIGDDCTSFLTRRLVDELHRRGRCVLGVFDPDDPRSKGELIDAGVDDLVARDATPAAFVAAISALHEHRASAAMRVLPLMEEQPPEQRRSARRPRIVAVGGAGGGVGATEIAIALAAARARAGEPVVLVDTDEVVPALAQRLNLVPYPNLRAAVDALEHGGAELASLPAEVGPPGLRAVPGLSNPRSWAELHAASTVGVLHGLAAGRSTVVANVGARLEDIAAVSGPARYGVSRSVVSCAGAVVGVAAPTPVGVARLLEWFSEVRALTAAPVHVVFNRAPASRFKRGELTEEVARTVAPAGVWFVPSDGRVEAAAWSGKLPTTGPFTRAVAGIAPALLPPASPGSGGHRRWAR